jgi:hypothetical protein
LVALSQGVTGTEASFGLFGRYAAWDGADPEPEAESAWADAGFNPDSGRWSLDRKLPSSSAGTELGRGWSRRRWRRLTGAHA